VLDGCLRSIFSNVLRWINMPFPSAVPGAPWKDIYMAAILESNPSRVPGLIAAAEFEIVKRVRTLFDSPDPTGETAALDAALHMLQTLKTCLNVDRDTQAA
jgi:hypothetical protein